jgi:hypothetical protein
MFSKIRNAKAAVGFLTFVILEIQFALKFNW